MKQAYRAADKQVEKKARLVDKGKGKDNNKVQFINERYEKFKSKDFPKTQESKHSKAPQAVVVEIRIPSKKDFADENTNGEEILEEAKAPRTAGSSLMREKQTAGKLKGIYSAAKTNNSSSTQIEDKEFTENGDIVLTVKTIRKFNEEAKRTNFYKDFDQIAAWLSAVERENVGHFQRTPRKNKMPHGGVPTSDPKNSERNACKSSNGKDKVGDKRGFLKLPQINSKLTKPMSSRMF